MKHVVIVATKLMCSFDNNVMKLTIEIYALKKKGTVPTAYYTHAANEPRMLYISFFFVRNYIAYYDEYTLHPHGSRTPGFQ